MLVMGAKLQTWMTLAPLNVGFGADVGANRRGGLLDLLGGLEFEFLAGDHRLGGRVEFVGDVAQVVGVFANVVRRFGEVAGIAACGACWRAFHGFGQCDRILQGFERGAVRHVIYGEFRCFFSFLLRFFKALLMRGERFRIQRAGVAGGLCHFALLETAMMATAASAMADTAIMAMMAMVLRCFTLFFCMVGCMVVPLFSCGSHFRQNVASIQKTLPKNDLPLEIVRIILL